MTRKHTKLMAHATSTQYGESAIAHYNERSLYKLVDPEEVIKGISPENKKAILDAQAGLIKAGQIIIDNGSHELVLNVAFRGQLKILSEGSADLTLAYQRALLDVGVGIETALQRGAELATNDFGHIELNIVERQQNAHREAKAAKQAERTAVEAAGVSQRAVGWALSEKK